MLNALENWAYRDASELKANPSGLLSTANALGISLPKC